MELRLKYNEHVSGTTAAAFIQGGDAATWLREIDSWNISHLQIECYVVPTSISNICACGLLVILPANQANQLTNAIPYKLVGRKLYIPTNAELYPAVGSDEVDKLLLYHVQFFHPTTGLIGFEKEDCVNVLQLVQQPTINSLFWKQSEAKPSLPVPLQSIRVHVDAMQNIIESFKDDIGIKPLEKIIGPPNNTTKALKLAKVGGNRILYYLLQILLFIPTVIGIILSLLFSLFGGKNSPSKPTHYREPSWLDKLIGGAISGTVSWMQKTMNQLQMERDTEINKLMNMFDTDPSEALKYALPLASMYANRGIETGGSSLFRNNNTLFNLSGLGGGKTVSSWDIGDRYNDLRSKYMKAAQHEMDRGNYKRAAYIYAHLLADYHSAANALMQGKMYREAAALYKDHLKRNIAAAECLEKGGLLNEAIDIYKEEGRHEKVGDLYTILHQKEKARLHYTKCIDTAIGTHDYLEAARLQKDKLLEPESAMATLKTGWYNNNNKPAECLKRYYEVKHEHQPEHIIEDVTDVYMHASTPSQQTHLLDVMLHVNKIYGTKAKTTTTEIAYEIISKQALRDDFSNLNTLTKFTDNDKFTTSDTSRYITLHKKQTALSLLVGTLNLTKDVKWFKAYNAHNCFYAFGTSGNNLVFARTNWYNNTDYAIWKNGANNMQNVVTAANPMQKGIVLVYDQAQSTNLVEKRLAANKYFNYALNVHVPHWLPADTIAVGIDNMGFVYASTIADKAVGTLNVYTTDGRLTKSIPSDVAETPYFPKGKVYEMIAKGDGFYFSTYEDGTIIFMGKDGNVRYKYLDKIYHFTMSNLLGAPRFVVQTPTGILFFEDKNSEFTEIGAITGREDQIVSAVFMTDNTVAIAFLNEVVVYTINKEATVVMEQDTEANIVAVLTTYNRNEIALLMETGEVKRIIIDSQL